jgi:hypothetical protein
MKLDLTFFLLERNLRQIREYINTLLGKKSTVINIYKPDNHIYKQNRITKIQKEYIFDTFIETGTYYGQMVYCVRNLFRRIYSIEIFEKLATLNARSFRKLKNISIICGDSSIELEKIMNSNPSQSILFWLDGHYSGIGTGRGEKITPIIAEIRIILKNNPLKYVIIIDDWRLFDGIDYPSKEDLLNEFSGIRDRVTIYTDSDALVIQSIE